MPALFRARYSWHRENSRKPARRKRKRWRFARRWERRRPRRTAALLSEFSRSNKDVQLMRKSQPAKYAIKHTLEKSRRWKLVLRSSSHVACSLLEELRRLGLKSVRRKY